VAEVDGDRPPDPGRDLARIAVIERHGKNGNIANGFVRGFGLKRGRSDRPSATTTTTSRWWGWITPTWRWRRERLGEIEGGFVVVEGGAVRAELALPVAGLMSLEPFETVREGLVALRAAARGWGWCWRSRSCSSPSWRCR
jgi:adenine deaminase